MGTGLKITGKAAENFVFFLRLWGNSGAGYSAGKGLTGWRSRAV
ncbi:hypothetical protein AA18889_0530 [Acetobacter senegalensis DSM 18889]|nr:hypothetical protein AA18889_0530 [Acetobacter senegalensis DSM 18889]